MDSEKSRRATQQWAKRRAERNSKWIVDSQNIVHIPLGKGREALIDVIDIEVARNFTWTLKYSHTRKSDGFICYYAYAALPGGNPNEVVQLHNIIMEPAEGVEVDHIDRDGLNCRRCNMRISLPHQNSANKGHTRSKQPYRGVYQGSESVNTWTATIMVRGKKLYRFGYKSERDAAIAYNELARQYHGQFAGLNVIPDVSPDE